MADDDRLLDTDTRRAMISVILILFGIGGLGRAAWMGITALRLGSSSAAEATGWVSGCHVVLGRFGNGTSLNLTLSFASPAGGLATVSTHSPLGSCVRARATSYRVRYLPDDPDVAMADHDFENASSNALGLAFISALMLGAGLLIWRIRSRAGVAPGDTVRDMPLGGP